MTVDNDKIKECYDQGKREVSVLRLRLFSASHVIQVGVTRYGDVREIQYSITTLPVGREGVREFCVPKKGFCKNPNKSNFYRGCSLQTLNTVSISLKTAGS
jgi:hypothetical protein